MDRFFDIILAISIAVFLGIIVSYLPFDRFIDAVKSFIGSLRKESGAVVREMSFDDVKKRFEPKNEGKPPEIVVENLERDLGNVEYLTKSHED